MFYDFFQLKFPGFVLYYERFHETRKVLVNTSDFTFVLENNQYVGRC